MKNKPLLIAVAVLLLIGFLLSWHFINKARTAATVQIALSQHNEEELITQNENLQLQLHGHRVVEDSLWVLVKNQEYRIKQKDKMIVQKEKQYQDELNRLQLLTDDEAVSEFLDNAECGEQPILKYDSLYLIDICPLRSYNDIRAGFEAQTDVNTILRSKLQETTLKEVELNGIITERGNQIEKLNQVVENTDQIVQEKDKQIQVEHKKYVQQKVKTYLVGAVGVLGITLGIIF